jgi:hypothetical protein
MWFSRGEGALRTLIRILKNVERKDSLENCVLRVSNVYHIHEIGCFFLLDC